MEKYQSNIVDNAAGGKSVTGMPLTTDVTVEAVPGLLTNAIDSEVVKIRPMATPLDQISRLGHVRTVDAMEVDYYSVDTRPDATGVTYAKKADDSRLEGNAAYEIKVVSAGCLEATDTFIVERDGELSQDNVWYVASKAENVLLCYGSAGATLQEGDKILRMGRAATQLDVQSPQFSTLPTKSTNYCQIFKMQIEQSVVMKMSHKEIGWSFTDQQESAIYDMRLGMEKQFLFGKKAKFFDPLKNENVMLTGGVWHQAGKDIEVDLTGFDSAGLIDMLRSAFTENSGSRRKILIAGSDLIAAINKIEHTHVITARDQVTAWGIDFSELQSKFGKLYVAYSDVFDVMGMPGNGMIIDPEYIQKHVFIPFNAEVLDLRGSGQRNTEAIVLTEASCLTLRYPDAHARVIGKNL
jgi:hypothetical protein